MSRTHREYFWKSPLLWFLITFFLSVGTGLALYEPVSPEVMVFIVWAVRHLSAVFRPITPETLIFIILMGGLVLSFSTFSIGLLALSRRWFGKDPELATLWQFMEDFLDPLFITDSRQNIVWHNKSFQQHFRRFYVDKNVARAPKTLDDLKAMLYGEESRKVFEEILKAADHRISSGCNLDARLGGQVEQRWHLWMQKLPDTDKIFWTLKDITARHQLEDVRKKYIEAQKDLSEKLPVGYIRLNQNDEVLSANKTLRHWLAVEDQGDAAFSATYDADFFARHFRNLHPLPRRFTDGQEYKARMVNSKEEETDILLSYVVAASGRLKDILVLKDPLDTPLVAPPSEQAAHSDARPSLALPLAQRDPIRSLPDWLQEADFLGLVLLDSSMRIQTCNKGFASLLNVPAAALVGKFLGTYVKEKELQQKFRDIFNRFNSQGFEGPKAYGFLQAQFLGDKTLGFLLMAYKDPSGGAVFAWVLDAHQSGLGLNDDKRQRILEINRSVPAVAHDFKNILGIIASHCDTFAMNMGGQKPVDEFLERIRQDIRRGQSRVKTLEDKVRTMPPQKISVNKYILHRQSDFHARFKGFSGLINIDDVEDALAPIFVSESDLDRIMDNLLNNAKESVEEKAMSQEEEKTITISAHNHRQTKDSALGDEIMPKGSYVRISVADTGKGIPPAELDKIFDPYHTTKRPMSEGGGTGQGLAVVKELVRKNRGFITISSEVLKGSVFHLFFPHHQEEAPPFETESLPPEEDGPAADEDLRGWGNLLFVEDEPSLLKNFAEILGASGYRVVSYDSGEEAWAYLEGRPGRRKEDRIDIVVTDISMGRMSGVDLTKKIHSHYPDLPVILGTGYLNTGDVAALTSGDKVDYVEKPYNSRQLLYKIKILLQRARREDGASF